MPATSHNHNSSSVLADLLSCSKCHKNFSKDVHPLSLPCGHIVCLPCLSSGDKKTCNVDQITFTSLNVEELPLNLPLLSIIVGMHGIYEQPFAKRSMKSYADAHSLPDADLYPFVEHCMILLARYFPDLSNIDDPEYNDIEKYENNSSHVLSRALKRKLGAMLCSQPVVPQGTLYMFCAIRSIAERVLTELILALQNSSNVSSHLWSAVRARGCQFLGPSMQEDVLQLILSALSKGELIARKALVMFIVQSLTSRYPHVSKTCVGHVVQLAYRASCFNVIKREGESSLMQLKDEFRDYGSLRREHDAQIVQIALEAGLRISPEQWSSLLYGDLRHRAHMQTIVDRISSPKLLANAASELRNLIQQKRNSVSNEPDTDGIKSILGIFKHLETLEIDDESLKVDMKLLHTAVNDISAILDMYTDFMQHRKGNGVFDKKSKKIDSRGHNNNGLGNQHLYKTRLCREIYSGKMCPHGENCNYAHGTRELRNSAKSGIGRFDFFVGAPAGPVTNQANGNGVLVDTAVATQSAALIAAQAHQLQAQTVAHLPSASPPLLTNVVDGSMTSLTPLMTNDAIIPSAQQMVGAIDSTTGGLVSLIPVQNVAVQNASTVTTIERVNNVPSNIMMEPIPLVPVILQSQPTSFGGDSVLEQQQSATPNILLLNQPRLTQLQPDTAESAAYSLNTSILVVPSPAQPVPIVPTAPAGSSTIFSIPIGAIPGVPAGSAGILLSAMPQPVGGDVATAPTQGVMSGFLMGTQPNFWSNDSCAKNDSGDESFFSKLYSLQYNSTGQHSFNNNVNSTFNVENSFGKHRCGNDGPTSNGGVNDNKGDGEQLLLRRNEIISQLVDMRPSTKILEDFYDDELENHVSYTVANSVLFDEKESYFTNGSIDLPPLPIGSFKAFDKKVATPRFYNTLSVNLNSSIKTSTAMPTTTNYLRTACANYIPLSEPVSLATVQSGCKNVIRDAIEQPLIASSLQNVNFNHSLGGDQMNPIELVETLPTVIKPLTDRSISHTQNLVSLSLDRIIDVKERINDVKKGGGAVSSAVEKEQLKVELSIAHRQITTLDEQTKESCLLKELKAVDKQIENLSMVV